MRPEKIHPIETWSGRTRGKKQRFSSIFSADESLFARYRDKNPIFPAILGCDCTEDNRSYLDESFDTENRLGRANDLLIFLKSHNIIQVNVLFLTSFTIMHQSIILRRITFSNTKSTFFR